MTMTKCISSNNQLHTMPQVPSETSYFYLTCHSLTGSYAKFLFFWVPVNP